MFAFVSSFAALMFAFVSSLAALMLAFISALKALSCDACTANMPMTTPSIVSISATIGSWDTLIPRNVASSISQAS